MVFTVEPDGSNDSGPCSCCGHMTRTVWGYLYAHRRAVAAYYIHWTIGRVDHGATVDLITGPWGPGTSPKDRSCIVISCHLTSDESQFMVVDAQNGPFAQSGLAKTALRRDQVIGTPLATKVFAMLDAIWLQDPRIQELTGTST